MIVAEREVLTTMNENLLIITPAVVFCFVIDWLNGVPLTAVEPLVWTLGKPFLVGFIAYLGKIAATHLHARYKLWRAKKSVEKDTVV